METTHEGFSIREYVSRMRSVNVVKCWPFDEATSEESVKSLLPPITVKKFIWWLDGLEHLHSQSSKNVDDMNSKSKRKKKKKKVGVQEIKGQSSLGGFGEEADRDDNVEESDIGPGEAKAPKKRSILEIFAVAPAVERVISSDEEEDEIIHEEDDGSCVDPKFSNRREEIYWGVKGKRNDKMNSKKGKKKKKMKNKNKDIILSKAKKVIKKIKKKTQKNTDQIHFMSKLQDHNKAIVKPHLSDEILEKGNDINICDPVAIQKKQPRLQHLDGHKKTNMTSKAFKLLAKNQHPRRGILKNHAKAFSAEKPTKCNLRESTMQVYDNGKQKADKHVSFSQKDNILRRKSSHPVECFDQLLTSCGSDMHNASQAQQDSTTVENEDVVSHRTENEVDGRSTSQEDNKGGPFSRSLSSDTSTVDHRNKHLFDISLRDATHDPKYACPSESISCMPREAHYNSRNVKVVMSSSTSNSGRVLIKDLGTPITRFPPMWFKDYMETHNEPSVSNKRPHSTTLNDGSPVLCETLPHFSPKELLQTVCSPLDGYQTASVHGKRIMHGVNEDLVGLPLNSQGELITLSSTAKGDFNQNNILSKCFANQSDRPGWDKLNLFPQESPLVFVPSRLDITESRGSGQRNHVLDLIKINDRSFHSENSLCKEDNHVRKGLGNEKIIPKMRLMGKEFVVGGRGFQGFEDGNIWKDKQIIGEHHFSNTSISNVMMHDQHEMSLGKLREFCPSEINIQPRSKSLYNIPQFDCRTSSMHQSNGFTARKINPVDKLYPGLSPVALSAVYNTESLFPEPFLTGYKPQVFNQDSCPNVSSSDIQLKRKQNLSHAPRSAIRFPFMHPDLEGHVNCGPSFFDVAENETLTNNFQTYHNIGSSHNPSLTPGPIHWAESSASLKPMYNPFANGSTLPSSVGSVSSPQTLLTQQEPIFRYPVAMPISSAQKRHRNDEKKIMSRIGFRCLDHSKKAKRQPCVNFEEVQNIETATESCSATHNSRSVMCDEYGNDHHNEQRVSSWIDTRSSGPIKLTAGAKHVLKACQQIDQGIPLAAASTAGFRLSESDNSAKMTYKF